MISIIIPIFNGDKFLEKTINSALNQDYPDIEILLINDGSSDKSQEIINKYVSRFPNRIRSFYQKNSGVCAARNNGIKEAKGSYIAFLDQDDIWHSQKLSMQIKILEHNAKIGLVICNFYIINEDDVRVGDARQASIKINDENVRELLFVNNVLGPPSCALIRKECFGKAGLFDKTLSSGPEDRDMWLRICNYYSIYFLNEGLCGFRFHANNAHRNISRMKLNQKKFIIKHKRSYNILLVCKAFAYVYLDAAREYYDKGLRLNTIFHSLCAIFFHPLPIDKYDDKYKLLLKAVIRYGCR